jgi:hypothetical protein
MAIITLHANVRPARQLAVTLNVARPRLDRLRAAEVIEATLTTVLFLGSTSVLVRVMVEAFTSF